MNKPTWEEFADAEKYDSTYDGIEIPYEGDDPKSKLNRISQLERRGLKTALSEKEIDELDSLYMEIFGHHLDEDRKKLYR